MKQILFLVCLPIFVCFLSCSNTSNDSDSYPRVNAYARSAWPTVHADGRNSDVIPYDGASDLTLAYRVLEGRAMGSTPTLSSGGQMYISVGGIEGILDSESFPGGLIAFGTGISGSGLVFHVTPSNGLAVFKPVSPP